MRSPIKFFSVVVIVIALLVIFMSTFVVTQGQSALVMRFGKLITDANGQVAVFKPGLHFKTPFITQAIWLDTRIQTLDVGHQPIVTSKKKEVIVDYYVKWRIADIPKFYRRTSGNYDRASSLLRQQINGSLRAQFGQRTIPEVVTDDRSAIMQALRHETDMSAKPLGIEIIDVRIKTIDLPDAVSEAVFARMRAERLQAAAQHRADGKSLAEAIRAKAQADVTVILAKAKRDAAKVRAEGDAKAGQIYTKAYSQDIKFYDFYRSLQAYEASFANKHDVMVVGPSSTFFKYMNHSTTKK